MSGVDIGPIDRIPLERGVAALVGTRAVAVFRLADDEIAVVDHLDPFTGAPVLARGLVASVDGRDVVVEPLHKQRFDLRSGECLDDPTVHVRVWSASVVNGRVLVSDGAANRSAA